MRFVFISLGLRQASVFKAKRTPNTVKVWETLIQALSRTWYLRESDTHYTVMLFLLEPMISHLADVYPLVSARARLTMLQYT
jgi:hypothetical protein